MFQNSVLKSTRQDESLVASRWAKFQGFKAKIEDIKEFKEEEYQDKFLSDIFENCLGYTLKTTNPQDYNLSREKKNETDSKKADGALHVKGEVVGVIELKDQKTKNLDTVQTQAFNYHNSHAHSRYIIISNFDELRFYIDKKTEFEKFSLFSLTYEDFQKLHLLLSFESIKDDLPLRLKEKSTQHEKDISDKLYKDFSDFRNYLFENIVKNNTQDKNLLLRLTQKLCDRIIFILFAEDRGLLRANIIQTIREDFANQKFSDFTLYDIYKFYFNGIDKGSKKLQIPKYNGGLFAEDETLNSLIIDDEILDEKVQKLSNYDFQSDIGVNILGHIFEQSLTDLEQMNANINQTNFDEKKSKRKKDGVFYTPEYITKYIVQNTLGKLCENKKEELGILHVSPPKNSKRPTKKEQNIKDSLQIYKLWLFDLKILDPACGSGAFLNQALDFLIHEHEELQKSIATMGDVTAYYQIEKPILENNLYGVDINEDATEIAKLSLWLRTASKGRELTKLADKIKCGNSLIDMPFEDVKFDVIIGNPPYVRNTVIPKKERKIYTDKYFVADGQYDLYVLFNEMSLMVAKQNGLIGFIQPNKFLSSEYGLKTLNLIAYNANINLIKNVSLDNTFADASVYPYIFIFEKKSYITDFKIKNISIFDICEKKNLVGFEREIKSKTIIDKIIKSSNELLSYVNYIKRGVPNNKLHFTKNDGYEAVSSIDLYLPYVLCSISHKIKYNEKEFEEIKINEFKENLILLPRTILKIRAIISSENIHILDRIYYFSIKKESKISLKTILTIINSKITTFYYNYFFGSTKIGGGYIDLKGSQIKKIPIPKNINQQPFIQKANQMLELNKSLHVSKKAFLDELDLEKIPKKLQDFEKLSFDEFIAEYKKAKKLKFKNKLEERNFKNEWIDIFTQDKKEAQTLQEKIQKTDNEIDKMVYDLYNLTDEEIAVVEGE